MMESKIEQEHERYINTILKHDVEAYRSVQDQLDELKDKRIQLEDKLKNLRIVVDRLPYFESFLQKLLNEDKITSPQFSAIVSYIKGGVILRWPASEYFTKETLHLKRLRKKLWENFPDSSMGSKFDEIVTQIANVENNKFAISGNENEYIEIQNKIKTMSRLIDSYEQKVKIENDKLKNAFYSEKISDINDLNTLCKNTESTKTELMIVESGKELDYDLASVIQMRAKTSKDKGNKLVIISSNEFNEIIKNAHKVNGVTKLSFLHHGDTEFGYVKNISDYINHLPNLKEIVLRGCGTAKKPQDRLPVYKVKKVKTKYDKRASVQGNQLVLQQKESEEGKILTRASWMATNSENKSTLHEIETELLPLIKKIPSDEQLKVLENIPGMPLLQHKELYIQQLKNNFFNPNKQISPEEKNQAKKAVRRARTEAVYTQHDLLSRVLNNMTNEQKAKISVKAYVGGYMVSKGRVIPDTGHDYGKAPKAVRIGPKPT